MPVYPQNCGPQYIQRAPSYPQNNPQNKTNINYPQWQQQQQQQHPQHFQQQQNQNSSQNAYYSNNHHQHQHQHQPIKSNHPTNQPAKCCQPNFPTNGNTGSVSNQPMNSVRTCSCVTVKPCDFRSVARPANHQVQNNNVTESSTHNPPVQEQKTENIDQVEITKFIKGTGFKQEPIETLESEQMSSPLQQPQTMNSNDENVDPNDEERTPCGGDALEDSNDGDDYVMTQDDEEISNAMENDEHFPVIEISAEYGEDHRIKTENENMQCNNNNNNNNNNSKLGIEAVTNRLALKERSKIFRRSDKKWHVAVNETAFQLVLKDPKLLTRKKDLRNMAETEVRKTYRFAKGKNRQYFQEFFFNVI